MQAAGTAFVARNAPLAFVLAALAVLGGCMLPAHESEVEPSWPAKVAPFAVDQTDRAAVRQALGKPWLSNDGGGIHVFRISDSNVSVVWMVIPVGISGESTKGCVLVTYDPDGKVTAYGHDVASAGSVLAERPDEAAIVHAAHVGFGISGDAREVFVAVSGARAEESMRTRPADGSCRMTVGYVQDWSPARVTIDRGLAIALPETLPGLFPYVAAVSLKPGDHRIELKPIWWSTSLQATTEFACAAGEVLHAAVSVRLNEAQPGGLRQHPLAAPAPGR